MTSIEMSFHQFIRQLDILFYDDVIQKASKYADEHNSTIKPEIENLQTAIKNLRKKLKELEKNEIQRNLDLKNNIAQDFTDTSEEEFKKIKKATIQKISQINPFHLIKIRLDTQIFSEKKKYKCIYSGVKLSPDETTDLLKKDYKTF